MYGRTYIAKKRKDIEEYFNEGVSSTIEKMSPAIMLESLKTKYRDSSSRSCGGSQCS